MRGKKTEAIEVGWCGIFKVDEVKPTEAGASTPKKVLPKEVTTLSTRRLRFQMKETVYAMVPVLTVTAND